MFKGSLRVLFLIRTISGDFLIAFTFGVYVSELSMYVNVLILKYDLKLAIVRKLLSLTLLFIQQQNSIDTSIIFRVIGHLSIFTPNHFSTWCNQTQFTDINFQNGTFGYHS